MARQKGSGRGLTENLIFRERPEVVDKLKKLADLNGRSVAEEVRLAVEDRLNYYAEALDGPRRDVTVGAPTGHLYANVKIDPSKVQGAE